MQSLSQLKVTNSLIQEVVNLLAPLKQQIVYTVSIFDRLGQANIHAISDKYIDNSNLLFEKRKADFFFRSLGDKKKKIYISSTSVLLDPKLKTFFQNANINQHKLKFK